MVKNLWGKIRVYCGNHGNIKNIEMTPHNSVGDMSMFYSCPKYYPDKREPGEKACPNHITLKEYERMLDYVSKLIYDAAMNNEEPYLTGTEWREKAITYRIINHTDKHIDILVLNKKALK